MSERPVSDRRRSARFPLSAAVTVSHPSSHRDFPARSVDVSQGGMLIYMPAAAPVAPGQELQIYIPEHSRVEFADLAGKTVPAHVVRVERQRIPALGYVPVGVRFDDGKEK